MVVRVAAELYAERQTDNLGFCLVAAALFKALGLFTFVVFLSLCVFSWTKERRVLLVKSFEKKKWVVVRPLPFSRTYPQQYDVSTSALFSLQRPSPLSHAEYS